MLAAPLTLLAPMLILTTTNVTDCTRPRLVPPKGRTRTPSLCQLPLAATFALVLARVVPHEQTLASSPSSSLRSPDHGDPEGCRHVFAYFYFEMLVLRVRGQIDVAVNCAVPQLKGELSLVPFPPETAHKAL